jgi:hypothetical protein
MRKAVQKKLPDLTISYLTKSAGLQDIPSATRREGMVFELLLIVAVDIKMRQCGVAKFNNTEVSAQIN